MANTIYVSLPFRDSKTAKIRLLDSEVSLINCMKKFENIKRIRQEKYLIKADLERQLSVILKKIGELEQELPKEKYHKKKEEVSEEMDIRGKKVKSDELKMLNMERELLEIRAKLRIIKAL